MPTLTNLAMMGGRAEHEQPGADSAVGQQMMDISREISPVIDWVTCTPPPRLSSGGLSRWVPPGEQAQPPRRSEGHGKDLNDRLVA